MSGRVYRFHVFQGKTGDRYVFRNKYAYEVDSEKHPLTPHYDASLLALGSGGEIQYHNETIDVPIGDDGDIPLRHVPGELISRIFLHGGCHCMFIGGPLFDSCQPP